MSAPEDLAYRIVALQHPHGRPTTSYCWPTQEQNDAAIERDRQRDAAKIRPLIEAEHAALLSQVARLRDSLKAVTDHAEQYLGMGDPRIGGKETVLLSHARALLAETEQP